jgi:hypothetical protein
MLRKLGGTWDRDPERFGVEVFQCILLPGFDGDGESEGGNVLVSGKFHPESLVIFFAQNLAVNGEVRLRHYGWGLVGTRN